MPDARPAEGAATHMWGGPLFDPVGAWEELKPDQQAAIGIAGIVYAFGLQGIEAGPSTGQTMWDGSAAAEAAAMKGEDALVRAVANALAPRFAVIHGHNGEEYPFPLSMPALAPLGIRQCRQCGCIDEIACKGGCGWIDGETPPLCSACAENAAEDAAEDVGDERHEQ